VAMVLVGAMIVASIETVWAGCVAPIRRAVNTTLYGDVSPTIKLDKGEEMGRFKLGSTVVLLFPENQMAFEEKHAAESPVRLGQRIGTLLAD